MALDLLQPIYDKFDGLSWADLIVVAGTEALEHAGGPHMCFCGGRTDASAGTVSDGYLKPTLDGSVNNTILQLKQAALVMGLTPREMTVLNGGGHSLGMMHQGRSGYTGAWTSNPTKLSNSFFSTLLSETWEPYTVPHTGMQQYKAAGKELYMLETDMMFKWDAEFLAISQDYAGDNQLFLKEFSAAWTKMMNADRFMGPSKNLCDKTCEPQVEAL
jgi:cytochrome c peroxidase